MWRRRARPSLTMAVLLAAGMSAGRPLSQTAPQFRADTTLVLIPVTVTDPANRFVLDLQQRDFHLFEDGTEQTITHLSGEDAPLSLGIVFDMSGSMADKMDISRQAAIQFLSTMNPEDEAFLVAFGDHAKLMSGFTSDMNQIRRQLTQLQPAGLTALLDATRMALDEMKKARNPRKAILMISDGGDNNSQYLSAQIESLVREADVEFYAMGVFEPAIFIGMTKEEISGPHLLAEIAQQTGGRVFAATDPNDLPSIATRIGIELRNQYVLAYRPKNESRDGKYRRVEVKVADPGGIPNLKLHWRLGYYAPTQ